MPSRQNARRRHLIHYQQIAAQAEQDYRNINQLEGLQLFDHERGQIDAGWNWLRQQPLTPETAQLLTLYADEITYVAELRYDLRQERIPQLERALESAQYLQNRHTEAITLAMLGRTCYRLGDIQQSIDLLTQARTIADEIAYDKGRSLAYGNLGSAYYRIGDLDKTIAYYKQALCIKKNETYDRRSEAETRNNLGLAYSDIGKFKRALKYNKKSFIIARDIGDRRIQGHALNGLGIVSAAMKKFDRAIDYQEKALVIARELGDHRDEGHALHCMAQVSAAQDNHDQAQVLLGQAMEAMKKTGDERLVAEVQWSLGELYAQAGEWALAIGLMQTRVDYERKIGHLTAQERAAYLEQLRQRLPTTNETATTIIRSG